MSGRVGSPPARCVRMLSSHGLALSNSLRFRLRGQLREFLRGCARLQTSRSLCTSGRRRAVPH
eukprot:scaffold109592_cov63-Phaeocystis_antarctica.AAC.1